LGNQSEHNGTNSATDTWQTAASWFAKRRDDLDDAALHNSPMAPCPFAGFNHQGKSRPKAKLRTIIFFSLDLGMSWAGLSGRAL